MGRNIPSWSPFLWPVNLRVFHKYKREKTNKTKQNFIKFAKFTVFGTLFIWFLPLLNYILDPWSDLQVIGSIYNILNSTVFIVYTQRIFEVVGPINALFGAVIIEEIYNHFSAQTDQNSVQANNTPKRKGHHRFNEKIFLGIAIGCLITINFFEVPYYEYNFKTQYSEGIAFFRQYLDANGTPGEIIGYSENDTEVRDLLIYFATPKFTLTPINATINATIARTKYLENISCPLEYLVISRNDDINWNDLIVNFSGSSNTIIINSMVMILNKKTKGKIRPNCSIYFSREAIIITLLCFIALFSKSGQFLTSDELNNHFFIISKRDQKFWLARIVCGF